MSTYIKIATVTVPLITGATSLSFTSIPNTYTDLCLKLSARNSIDTLNQYISLNSSTTNFSSKIVYGSGSAAGSSTQTDNWAFATEPSSYTANTFGSQEFYFPNYAGSANKSFSSDLVTENNATTVYMGLAAGLWSNTSAITSITLTSAATSFYVQYTSATLYGIKKS